MTINLGKLKRIDNLRAIWENEQTDFSKWLSKEENLELLSEEIGINLSLQETEARTGSFYIDILATEVETGKKVVIENQLEKTNHDHLGKIITYASGYEAEYIIWIVKDFREEHKQALDWLNENTNEKINFFGIKMELWQIDTSKYAPKFNIISQPNQWSKALRGGKKSTTLSEIGVKQINFIEEFRAYCTENESTLQVGKAQNSTPAYYTIGIGMSEGWVAVKLNTGKNILKVDFYFVDKEYYSIIKQEFKNETEAFFNNKLVFDDMEKYKGAVISTSTKFKIDNQSQWKTYFEWIRTNAEIMQKQIPDLIKNAKEFLTTTA
ncbi:DUF4268 domain-containing protein [Marinifilum sp. N1E240]|uniref:DUF4268 domain-containing protein n=1 Tax=Marinifilum sp. N1E240 TaxID=2608082 RepID=UPI00128AEBF4|nr:DUF4268 domain-containing protein [Marinifilum sp. N1E240]MPQ46986.1 DUF4268 domain-containing protein [Marinifilum sp. N1E240]